MTYTKPTVDEFVERFPVFDDRDEDHIQVMIDEAARSADDDWTTEEDYRSAVMYLAAHLLVTDDSQSGDTVTVGSGQGAISSESFGGMSVSYASAASNTLTDSAEFGSTIYGRRYLTLLRNNKPPIVVV